MRAPGAGAPATRPLSREEPAARPPRHRSSDDDDEESMLAEAGSDTSEHRVATREEAALELLQNELGARRIERRRHGT